jgi:hypothetical protein
MDSAQFCVAALASWRLAHLLHAEDGPGRCIARLRGALTARQLDVLECFLCTSVWTALPVAALAGRHRRELLIAWPALSAAAVLIERAAFPAAFADVPAFSEDVPEFFEDEEAADVLRQI